MIDKILNFLSPIGEWLLNHWLLSAFVLIVIGTIIRINVRGYFWEARDGSELSLKEFFASWGKGIEGITPLAQIRTTLWSFPLVVGGQITGLVIMIFTKQWWLVVLLAGSIPITLMGVVGVYQKYRILKKVQDTLEELEGTDELQ